MTRFASLCAVTILGVGSIATAPVASAWTVAGSGCVRSGNTEDYCISRFIESVDTMGDGACDAVCQPQAIQAGLAVIDSMARSFDRNSGSLPPEEMFYDCIRLFKLQNPWANDGQAKGFVRVSIHWFGPPGMEEAVNQIVGG